MNRASLGAIVLVAALAGAPVIAAAQPGSGGGGHSSGGGHASGGGGGHTFASGGGHAPSGHYPAGHYAGYAGHAYASPHYGAVNRYAPPGSYPGYHGYYPGHPGAPYATATGYWHGGYAWNGGYYHGVFWPHVWYYPGWAWYLPALPFGYATFWWGGVPFYYCNNLYYTWSPGYNGYVVSDPPPAAETDNAAGASPDEGYEQAAPTGYNSAPPAGGSGDVYVYPRNGQSETQTQTDRYECHSWAVSQTGFDPTRAPAATAGTAAAYRRAIIACLDARGYSAR